MRATNVMNEAQIEQYMEAFQEKRRRADEQALEDARKGLPPEVDYLVFALGGEEFAVTMRSVQATMAVPACTPVPFVGSEYRGILAVRGRIISVVDLRLRLGLEAAETAETTLVVLEHDGDWRGFVVDSVNRALSVKHEDELKPVARLEPGNLFRTSNI